MAQRNSASTTASSSTPQGERVLRKQHMQGGDIGRFVAATLVITLHTMAIPKLELDGPLGAVLGYGGIASYGVPLFFTFSAFALSYGYFGRLETGDQIRSFYFRRLRRIAPLFYLMMAYYLIFLWLAFDAPVDLSHIITSATFTFNLVPDHVTGYVYASWSIGAEMLFYAVFPFIMLFATTLRRSIILFVLALFVTESWQRTFYDTSPPFSLFGQFSFISYVHFFAGGIVAYHIWRRINWTPSTHRILIGCSIVAFGVLVWQRPTLLALISWSISPADARPLLQILWTAPLMCAVLGLSFSEPVTPGLKQIARFGETSYSMYLLHPAVISLLTGLKVYDTIARHFPGNWAYVVSLAMTLSIVLPLARLTYEWVELRFYSPRAAERPTEPVQGAPAQTTN